MPNENFDKSTRPVADGQDLGEVFAPLDAEVRGEVVPLPPPSLDEVMADTADWDILAHQLHSEIDTAYKHPFIIRPDKSHAGLEIPINAAAYEGRIKARKDPEINTDGCTVLRDVAYGYTIKGQYRYEGRIDYLVLDMAGHVLEAGCANDDARAVFEENIFGLDIEEEAIQRTREINERLIRAMRADPSCQASLEAFLWHRVKEVEERQGRGARIAAYEGYTRWGETAELAYYSPELFNIRAWGRENKIEERDLYLAGFLDRRVTTEGVRYYNRRDEMVFIPFRNNEGEMVLWRTRTVNPRKGDPKYRSAPLDRAHRQPETVHRQLYQAELLENVENKRLIITEGEFKCMVAAQMTGVATVGITGITQVTDEIIEAIRIANPGEIIILLDRDTKSRGLARFDELTDSQRAAYLIARRLARAGLANVKIATLPDVFEGQKVGLDDFLLDAGAQNAPAALEKVLAESRSIQEYEQDGKVDPRFHDLFERRQRVTQTLRDYSRYVDRAPIFAPGSSALEQAETRLARLTEMASLLDRAHRHYLDTHYQGTRRVTQPPRRHLTLYGTPHIHDAERKYLTTSSGRNIPIGNFRQDVLLLRAHPPDLPEKTRPKEAPGFDFPFSMQHLTEVFHGRARPSHNLRYTFNRGTSALELEPSPGNVPWRGMTYNAFVRAVFAGYLTESYPLDEYYFETDLVLRRGHPSYWEEAGTVEIAILRDDDLPLALCSLPQWEHRPGLADASRASHAEGRNRAGVRCFLRAPELKTQREQLDQIAAIITRERFALNLSRTCEALKPFGISAQVVRESGAMVLDRSDWQTLINSFGGLLNQAFQCGLLVPSMEGYARPRFKGEVLFIPDRDSQGICLSFTVLPLELVDRLNGALPPVPKTAHWLDAARSITPALDQSRNLFQGSELAKAKGGTVLVASGEIEALQLRSALASAGIRHVTVVALRELSVLERTGCDALALARPKRVIFVSQEGSANVVMRRHGELAFYDAEAQALSFLRACGEGAPAVAAARLKSPPIDLLSPLDEEGAAAFVRELLEAAAPVSSSHRSDNFTAAKHEFSEALRALERAALLTSSAGERTKVPRAKVLAVLQHYYQRLLAHADQGLSPELLKNSWRRDLPFHPLMPRSPFLTGVGALSTATDAQRLIIQAPIYAHSWSIQPNARAHRQRVWQAFHSLHRFGRRPPVRGTKARGEAPWTLLYASFAF